MVYYDSKLINLLKQSSKANNTNIKSYEQVITQTYKNSNQTQTNKRKSDKFICKEKKSATIVHMLL